MFGYVTINQDELKIRDYRRYRSFYCGLCRSLQVRYGIKGQVILPYDMVFADILLNGLYEQPLTEEDRFCIAHPAKKQHMLMNSITDYAADMGILLVYYKFLDDALDEGGIRKRVSRASIFKKPVKKVREAWPRQAKAVERYILELRECEEKRTDDLDRVAGLTGTALGEIFVMEEDMWSEFLRRMGFFLGKYIYLMDAYEDLREDVRKGNYNPWIPYKDRPDFGALVESTLTMMMSECAKEFEKLPIVQDVELLRNIIYSGVWNKYREQLKEREGSKGKETT